MLLRILFTIILGLSFLVVGCNDVTDADLSRENQAIEPGNVESFMTKNKGNASKETILEIAADNDNFSILAEAVGFAGLGEALDGKRQLTVFAPTDDAFFALLEELDLEAEELFAEGNEELVANILLYHVASGKRASNAVLGSKQINTLLKKFIDVELDGNSLTVGNDENGFANVLATDVFASNGVIHVIDAVMLPPTSSLPPTGR